MREQDLWRKEHIIWSTHAHCTRIENTSVFGVPDVHVQCDELSFWIENKIIKNHTFIIRPAQLAWISKQLSYGGTVYIFAGDGAECVFISAKELFKHSEAVVSVSGQLKCFAQQLPILHKWQYSKTDDWLDVLSIIKRSIQQDNFVV